MKKEKKSGPAQVYSYLGTNNLSRQTVIFLKLISTFSFLLSGVSCAPENKGQRSDALAVSQAGAAEKSDNQVPPAQGAGVSKAKNEIMKPGGSPPVLPEAEGPKIEVVVLKKEPETMLPAVIPDAENDPKPTSTQVGMGSPTSTPAPSTCKDGRTDANEVRYVNTVSGVNLRSKPAIESDSTIILLLPNRSKLTLHWGASGWACVTDLMSKNVGYVSSEFMSVQ